jgi:hypothetical protein
LGKLPKRRRVAFALCAIEGMSPTENFTPLSGQVDYAAC